MQHVVFWGMAACQKNVDLEEENCRSTVVAAAQKEG